MIGLLERRPLASLLVLLAALAATISLELQTAPGEEQDVTLLLPPTPSQASGRTDAVAPPPEQYEGWTAVALARPLFAPNRRPRAAASTATQAPTVLPRLTGVVIYGEYRRAIFTGAGGAKPVPASERANVVGYTVQSIKAGQVTLAGPGGTQVLRPSFDARPPQAAGASPVSGGPAPFAAATDVMQSLRGLPGFSGTAR